MDNAYHLDYKTIRRTIRKADVVMFRFMTVPMRLLIDNRFSEVDPPMVRLVPRVESAEERFKNLKMLRPRFKLPHKISAIWWPRYVDGLEESGIWADIVQRIVDSGYPATARECEEVLQELRSMERLEIVNAIGGEGYKTLWPATR